MVEEIYPVGNTGREYYDQVIEFFQAKGADFNNSNIVMIGSDLIGWYLKDRFPQANVTTIEENSTTSRLQNRVGELLYEKAPADEVLSKTFEEHLSDSSEAGFIGTTYSDVVYELENNVSPPDESIVSDFRNVGFDADIVFTNNVYDYSSENFFSHLGENTSDQSYLELYSVPMPDESRFEGLDEAKEHGFTTYSINPVELKWGPELERGDMETVVLFYPD